MDNAHFLFRHTFKTLFWQEVLLLVRQYKYVDSTIEVHSYFETLAGINSVCEFYQVIPYRECRPSHYYCISQLNYEQYESKDCCCFIDLYY
jgi:hypothetical protein